jgi:hypothetical protein
VFIWETLSLLDREILAASPVAVTVAIPGLSHEVLSDKSNSPRERLVSRLAASGCIDNHRDLPASPSLPAAKPLALG